MLICVESESAEPTISIYVRCPSNSERGIKRIGATDGKEKNMPAQALFGISVAFGFIAWGIVAAQ